ncbi:hypothetical protein QE152_g9044 [Popillia japonica]|uniref:Uncharacterized protein n=1 Tax=Popillia japonica TaxID=7064 RepID=A0AAW1M127_POPJA
MFVLMENGELINEGIDSERVVAIVDVCGPDIAALRTAAAVVPRPTATPALEDLEPAPRRQASVDAEAIRIVIHDVDSAPAASAQRRIILRRDPTDKAHRSKLNTTR